MRHGIIVLVTGFTLTSHACTGLIVPVVDPRVVTEIHGVPPTLSAHVQSLRFFDYPFDGSVVELFDFDIEVDDPPPSNHVHLVGSVKRLSRSRQRVHLSFFGPNAMDDSPIDDEPIFTDLYGTYTTNNGRKQVTGAIDLFDIGCSILWEGIDASTLTVNPDSVQVSVVNIDGRTIDIGFGQHPLSFSVVQFPGDPNQSLVLSFGSGVFFGGPWVPELVEMADEVHFQFDVYLPAPPALAATALPAAGR